MFTGHQLCYLAGKDDAMKILKVNLSKNTGDFNVSYSLGEKYISHAETCC